MNTASRVCSKLLGGNGAACAGSKEQAANLIFKRGKAPALRLNISFDNDCKVDLEGELNFHTKKV